jgi:hypothetical protein
MLKLGLAEQESMYLFPVGSLNERSVVSGAAEEGP